MTIDELKQSLPDFAKDIRLNVGNLFGNVAQSGLTDAQFYGTALAVAYSLRNKAIVDALLEHASDEVIAAAQSAATLMAMNNVYYRAIHLAEDKDLASLPANLRMNAMLNPPVAKADFEMYALAVSAVNGCGMCIHSHVRQLQQHGLPSATIQTVLRIAATLTALDQALFIA